jgi:hypothetical protein
MSKLASFLEFTKNINEGGAAIKSSRSIREDEAQETIDHIKSILFPILGISPDKEFTDYMLIGSIGKKINPDDLSGDIDLGYNGTDFARKNGISFKECSAFLRDLLYRELPGSLGYQPEMKALPGLNILSIGWPIKGDEVNGIVQLDLIPVTNMNWAKFIYYSPDYRLKESNWKSAHRNWLLSAALIAQQEILDRNEEGEIMDYKKPVLLLPSGLWLHTKTYKGERYKKGDLKMRLKNSQKVPGSEEFVTDDPQEFVDFALGTGYKPEDVRTFEQVLKIMTSPNFKYREFLPEIKEKFIELLNRTKLPIPPETELLSADQ